MASAARTLSRAALRSSASSLSSSSSPLQTSTLRAAARFAIAQQTCRHQSRRGYADNASSGNGPSGGSSSKLPWLIGIALAAGGAGYAYTTMTLPDDVKEQAKEPFKPTFEDYQKVYDAIAKRLEEESDYDDGSYGPILLRLGWHASGTYDASTQTGGSNGATMRFAPESDHGANAGLSTARAFLQPIHAHFPWLTHSDLWTLAAVCAIQEMQGPKIPWRPGRADRDVAFCTPDGRLPDARKEQSHLRAIFGRMGFEHDREIVALSGAHALGRCHVDRSGFEGPWTFSPTVLTNEYFKLLLGETWRWRKWDGARQYEGVGGSRGLMMLPTDMALVKDKGFRRYVEVYAADNEAFFRDFADVVMRLFELGVPFGTGEEARMRFRSSFD
ncbi:cytochrome c peroxidase-like protein [Pseudovirgaria hyperparasitica]|uniref:Peroxidase n=1 Tax=Pseudovirgaria hyperparasitica TaxID=470096 RepID=A0A6A6W9X9_9PEZI|nr:cytochrome c peroxidase-like protein [Pseudovirgaria hyperparasitica]KAF2759483.1 cytochrome c peroxidase-like protein [Pseudovirgaria hyperparasitica]